MSHSETNKELAVRRREQFRILVAKNTTYPLATITYHGPGPDQASKITVGIIKSEQEAPLIRSWEGLDIANDVESAREISLFLRENAVSRVLTSEWVLSCPHEEGADYPAGQDCPFCPDWR